MTGYSLPATYKEITLRTFIAWHKAKNDAQKVMAITGKPFNEVKMLRLETIKFIVDTFNEVLALSTALHVKIIKQKDGKEYGFIPELTSMTYGEFVDIASNQKTIWGNKDKVDYTNLPKLMSIFYRPITERIKDKYRIAKYDSENVHHTEDILNMSMDKVNGALLFFWHTRRKLQRDSPRFLAEMLKKEVTELKTMLQQEMD